jgi:DNA topoisomerase-6 subunit B
MKGITNPQRHVAKQKITSSSTAEYFSKNLQQVGFSSPTKAVLTTLKEAVDNSLDACEEADILPEISVEIEKVGAGTLKNTDLIRIRIEDNGPGLEIDDVTKVFGEYLASSKFGRGRCSRGQQGIGISAATTWAQLTSAKGVQVITKTAKMRQAVSTVVQVDIKNNKGVLQDKKTISWNKPHGVSVEFLIDGRLQMQGEGGLLTYLTGTALVNPHLTLKYKIGENPVEKIERVTKDCPQIPDATEPHPHTMKLGEFIAHSHLFGKITVAAWLKRGFSRMTDNTIQDLIKAGIKKAMFEKSLDATSEAEFKDLFSKLQSVPLMAPSTRSVITIGEEAFSKSVRRLGEVDFFSVVTRRPTICDFKPVAVEVAVARLKNATKVEGEDDSPATILRFANRVPLQFDKAACAMVKSIESVNWRTYGLQQPKNGVPSGPYVIAVSLVSPFIKFKNASKETVDASDELVEEFRRALIQAGQRLSRHIRRESREADLENKIRHIEQFCPILVDCLCRITKSPVKRKEKATQGLVKLLGRDVRVAEKQLEEAVEDHKKAQKEGKIQIVEEDAVSPESVTAEEETHASSNGNGKHAKAVPPPKKPKSARREKSA